MKRAALGMALLIAAGALSAAGLAAFRRERSARPSGLSTAVVTKGTFVDFLQLRGEIRPTRSVVLSAPSSGSDLQIIDLVKNGARVSAGDVVVAFDPTVQQRTLETKQSELKQAESEVERTGAELTRRVQAARSELDEARKAVQRARLDVQANELRARIEAEKFVIALSDAETHVGELEQKVEGERMAAAADVAIARQKREKAHYDVRRDRAHHQRADDPRPGRRIDLAAAELPRRRPVLACRARIQARRSRLVRRADRRAAGPQRREDDGARRRVRSGARPAGQRRQGARGCGAGSRVERDA